MAQVDSIGRYLDYPDPGTVVHIEPDDIGDIGENTTLDDFDTEAVVIVDADGTHRLIALYGSYVAPDATPKVYAYDFNKFRVYATKSQAIRGAAIELRTEAMLADVAAGAIDRWLDEQEATREQ